MRDILTAIRAGLRRPAIEPAATQKVRIRILMLSLQEDRVVREEVYRSPVYSLNTDAAR